MEDVPPRGRRTPLRGATTIPRLAPRFRLRTGAESKSPKQQDALRRHGMILSNSPACRRQYVLFLPKPEPQLMPPVRPTGACRSSRRRAGPRRGQTPECLKVPKTSRKGSVIQRYLYPEMFLLDPLNHTCRTVETLNDYQVRKKSSLHQVAALDSCFLKFDAQRCFRFTSAEQARAVLSLATLLLDQLAGITCDSGACRQAAADQTCAAFDELDLIKYLANLEHVLCCIQHVAMVSLLQGSLEALDGHRRLPKHMRLQKTQDGEWFTEWSGGRPPLSSTMPWNIKPSLVVLWGVCWMFYTPENRRRSTQQEAAAAWASAQPGQGNVELPGKFGPSHVLPIPWNGLID